MQPCLGSYCIMFSSKRGNDIETRDIRSNKKGSRHSRVVNESPRMKKRKAAGWQA